LKTSTIIIGTVAGIGCLGVIGACIGTIALVGLSRTMATRSDGVPITVAPAVDDLELQSEQYAEARKSFRTVLRIKGPSPQALPLNTDFPPEIQSIEYMSGGLKLKAYVDPAPADGQKRPAVLFLHGGFAFGEDDPMMPQPYRDAGYIVMLPILRGENGQPGTFTLFYDEVDDVLSAADSLAALPYVDADRIFVAGHSAGGTLAQLASMTSKQFRAAASFSGSCNQRSQTDNTLLRFDTSDVVEYLMRSPQAYATSYLCPIRLYFGTEEIWAAGPTRTTVDRAQQAGIDIASETVPGGHMTCVPESIRRSIQFFKTFEEHP
jgi:dienelactone hydrolase